MRVGILGSGNIARIHGRHILNQPNAKIVGIADKIPERAKTLAGLLNVDNLYESADELISQQRPDIVHVLTPPHSHAELSILAMDRGCHVLVEKPMALNVNDAKEMIEVSKKNNVKLCVNHNVVFENSIQKAIELTQNGLIGKLISIEVSYAFNPSRYPAIIEEGAQYWHWTYRMNGGPLQDLMPHPASVIMEFIPDIKELHCLGYNHGSLPEGWQDEIRVIIQSDGILGYISISLNEKPDVEMLVIKGTKGVLRADLFNNIITIQKKSPLPRFAARGLSGFQLSYQYLKGALANIYKLSTGSVKKQSGTGLIISKLYESITNGGEPPVDLNRSRNVVDLMCRVWPLPSLDTQKAIAIPKSLKKKHREVSALVTGASGFIGSHLVNKLMSENIAVRALVRPYSLHTGRLKGLDVDIIEGDLINPQVLYEATKGIKTVYHAGAATSGAREYHKQVTINGTRHLLKASIENKVERFVHFSTLAVYDLLNTDKNAKISENTPYQKKSEKMGPYAYSKIEAEKLVFDAYRKHGLKVTIVRPGIVIGPRGRVFFPHLGYRYQDLAFLIIGKGANILPLTYVENTVDGIYKASILEKAVGQAYNLVDDGQVTTKDYLENFIHISGIHARIISLPYAIPYFATVAYEFGAVLGLLKKNITSRKQLKWKHKNVCFDSTKAKNELGWRPTIPIEDGINKTFLWYQNKFMRFN